jgi:hypothetical protein
MAVGSSRQSRNERSGNAHSEERHPPTTITRTWLLPCDSLETCPTPLWETTAPFQRTK